jgi:hypothetical protein
MQHYESGIAFFLLLNQPFNVDVFNLIADDIIIIARGQIISVPAQPKATKNFFVGR